MWEGFKCRWRCEGGYGQLLYVATPLILSMGSHSALMFVDRMLLSWYSADSLAASHPAGLLHFSFLCFFLGVVMYTSTFVAQYVGAKREDRVGAAIWHGVFFALAGGLLLPILTLFADEIFDFIGHAPEIAVLEAEYFSIVNLGSFFFLANGAFSCFYSGRGRSWTIVWINLLMAGINVLLDYLLIFGKWGFPEMGIRGAALASVIAAGSVSFVYAFLVCGSKHEKRYRTRSSIRWDKQLFLRMARFGTPSGGQFFLDLMGFTIFVMLVGRIGKVELAASNIVLNINLVGFLPIIGLGIATSIMVGQFQGARQSASAVKTTYTAIRLALAHNIVMVSLYLFIPHLLAAPFLIDQTLGDQREIAATVTVLLQILAAILFLDSIAIVSSAALKGAGDTAFVMWTLAINSIFFLVIPAYLIVEVWKLSLATAWLCLLVNMAIAATVFMMRFRSGKWQSIELIERDEQMSR